jgi:predicted RND superfamily exporter protein
MTDLAARGVIMTREEQESAGSSALCLISAVAGALPGSEAEANLKPLFRGESDRSFLQSGTGKHYFLRVLPTAEYRSLYIAHQAIDRIRDVLDRVGREFSDLEVGLTGKLVLLSDQMAVASRDMATATLVSSALVFLAFVVLLRGLLWPTFAMLCLSMGICWSFGFTTLAVGELTLLSAVFTPVLVGIGIDYGIHLLMRYQEERRTCAAELAMRRALAATTRGNLTGALTTCVAFFTAMLTNSPGFSQLGLIAGSGVLLCMLSMTVVLPSVVVLHERLLGSSLTKKALPDLRLAVPSIFLRPGLIVGVGVASVMALMMASRVGFRDNVLELQPPNLPSVQWEERVLADGNSTLFAAVVAHDLNEVRELTARLERLPSVGVIHSALDAVRPVTVEREGAMARLRQVGASEGSGSVKWDGETLAMVAGSLKALEPFARQRSPKDADRMAALASNLKELSNDLRSGDSVSAGRVRERIEASVERVRWALTKIVDGNRRSLRDALPESVRPMLMSEAGRFLIMVHPKRNIWDFENLTEFVGELRTVDPGVTGFPVIHLGTVNDLRRSFYLSSVLALVSVACVVWLDFRSWQKTGLAMLPLLVALVWTLAWMGMVGADFNLVNFIAVPILIGVGVDNGVHIVHRYAGQASGRQDMGSTSLAVLLTSLTNMFGFGSLMISAHRGAQSLGLVILVGCVLTLLASLTILPGMILWRRQPAPVREEFPAPVIRRSA